MASGYAKYSGLGGGSGGGGGGNIATINGNSTPDQIIAAGTGITVGSSGGTTTITATGGGAGITSINTNTNAAQTITGGTGISVSSSGGTTTVTNSATARITSINTDTTAAQVIAGGTGITVATVSGTTTISASGGGGGANTALSNLASPAINTDLAFAGTAAQYVGFPSDGNNTAPSLMTVRGQDKTGHDQNGGDVKIKAGGATGITLSIPGNIVFETGGGGYSVISATLDGFSGDLSLHGGVRVSAQTNTGIDGTNSELNVRVNNLVVADFGQDLAEFGANIVAPNDLPGYSTVSSIGLSPTYQGGTQFPFMYISGDMLLMGYSNFDTTIPTHVAGQLKVKTGTNLGVYADNVILNPSGSAVSTSATSGFTYIPTCAGAPTGTPATLPTGAAPMIVDTTDSKLYVYIGGAWKSTLLI